MLKGIIPFAHQLLTDHVKEQDIVIDATCGNGHDTLLLASLVGPNGHVYAFDVQKQAINQTKQKLNDANLTNTTYVLDSHDQLDKWVPANHQGKIAAAIFNLGYLPGSDKAVITKASSTIRAVELLLQYIQKDGLIILVVYHGHPGGKMEKDALISFAYGLDQKQFAVLRYEFVNQVNHPPFVLAIQKR